MCVAILPCTSIMYHVTGYRRLFKQYVEKYKEKLLTSSPSADLLAELLVCYGDVMVSMVMCIVGVQQLEDQLDIDNIVVARNEAEIRVSVSSGCITSPIKIVNSQSLVP